MMDCNGNAVGSGTTPPVHITDERRLVANREPKYPAGEQSDSNAGSQDTAGPSCSLVRRRAGSSDEFPYFGSLSTITSSPESAMFGLPSLASPYLLGLDGT